MDLYNEKNGLKCVCVCVCVCEGVCVCVGVCVLERDRKAILKIK
jgi:hypothetical protein